MRGFTRDGRARLHWAFRAWLYELGCRESSLPRGGRLDPAGFHPHACALLEVFMASRATKAALSSPLPHT
ncbi:Cell division septum initiation DivIVA [Pseudomonas syringae pv. actinidiae]|uniref:Cell division septum initiation DivIVA n=1 Tax=Pseudomonas syringae pv. actinidiae TaxID=103796 RepID=A0AAN4Q6S8_PSESF|nr:Cell division septum initiation DivIVA [Pseudomonas syringae pv. actinidiae]